MPENTTPASPTVYQLRVVMHGVSPLIWRRLLVRADTTIAGLHAVVQAAFGWDGEHLHRFVIHEHRASEASVRGTPPSAHSPTHKRAATTREAPWLAPIGPRVCTPLLNLPVPVWASQRWPGVVSVMPSARSRSRRVRRVCRASAASRARPKRACCNRPERACPRDGTLRPISTSRSRGTAVMRSAIADRTAATSTGDRVCNIRTAATCIDVPETSHTNSITSFWLARWVPIPAPHIHVTCSMLHPANRRAIGTKVPRVPATVAASAGAH